MLFSVIALDHDLPQGWCAQRLSGRERVLVAAVALGLVKRAIGDLERMVDSLMTDREKAMRWGILTLGSAVLAMASYIFNFVTGHLK